MTFGIAVGARFPQSHFSLVSFTAAAVLGIYIVSKSIRGSLQSKGLDIVPCPRETILPYLTRKEAGELPYPPDALPGARDVDSPYGSTRVYEWGPVKGRKVLLIHGISTPSIALAALAHSLVERGCRVMLFDLFNRGYSSGPSSTTPYSNQLYTTQIHLVLASSPLSWTTSGFSLIGYSLGGALAADFTSYFPTLVNSLVLIASGGLIRRAHITWKSQLLYSTSGLLPQSFIERLVAKRLYTGPPVRKSIEPEPVIPFSEDDDKGGLRATAVYTSSHRPLLPGYVQSTVGAVVDWQIRHHRGFVPAFISSIQHAPIHEQHARWRVIAGRLVRQYKERDDEAAQKEGLERNKVLMILGEKDPIILAEELAEDAREVLWAVHVDIRVLEGAGHEVPIERADEVAKVIWGFWEGSREDAW